MTDMMVQPPPVGQEDDLRSLANESTSIEEQDDLRTPADDPAPAEEQDKTPVAEDIGDTPAEEITAPVAEVSPEDVETKSDPVASPVSEPAQTTSETAPDDASDNIQETPAKAPVAASIVPPPAPPKADIPAETPPARVAPVISTGDISDEYNPTLALRLFNMVRDSLIKIFDVLLTGLAIILEFLAGLDWAGYREGIRRILDTIHHLLPEKYRKVIYGVVVLVIVMVVMTGSALIAFSGTPVSLVLPRQQTIPVSQTQSQTTSNGILSPIFTPTVQQWAEQIAIWTDDSPELSANQLAIVMQLESCGNLTVANGLFGQDDAATTISDADTQAQIALSRLQAALVTSNGDFALALAVYTDGEAIMRTDFADWTLAARDMFILGRNMTQQIERGDMTSPDLNSWLQNTGAMLCTEGQSMRGN